MSSDHQTAEQSGLSRTLKHRHVTMISIGGIIGAGLFVGSSVAIADAGAASVLSYLGCGVMIVLLMQMLGEMAVALPSVRSFSEFTRAALGEGAGFVCGWLYWYFWVVVIPVEAIAGAVLLHGWLGWPTWAMGLALMAAMTGVNLMSARSYGEFEFWFASIKVAAIIVFIALASAFVFGFAPQGDVVANLTGHGGFAPHGTLAVLAALATVFFAMTGAEITTVASAESAEPARAIATMTRSVMVRIMVFYVLSILCIVAVVPWSRVVPGFSPFTLALLAAGHPWIARSMSVVILTAVLSCLNSAFYVCSRVLFVLAEKGDAPKWLVKLNARHVPARSVAAGAVVGVLGILANSAASKSVFAFLVNAGGALIVFVYLLTAASQIRLRFKRRREGQPEAAIRMWGFPWLSYATIAGLIAVCVAMAMSPDASQLYASLGALALAVTAYALRRRAVPQTKRDPAGDSA
ncbi:MAG: amino acid permease [Steroidobacteraceae bacterium]